jgi:hypothetical protein
MSAAAFYLAKTLEARERGSLSDCMHYSSVAQHHAERDREPDVGWRALTACGMLHLGRGEPEKARPWFGMALEYAKSHNLVKRVAGSSHDLLTVASETGDQKTARHFAAVALELYSPRSPRVAVLISDLSLCRLRKGEDAAYARLLWRPVYDSATSDARTKLIAAVWLLTAAAYTGITSHYTEALACVASAVQMIPHGECVAATLNTAVRAMLHKGDFERAFTLAGTAELSATSRGEDGLREHAAYLKDRANTGRAVRLSA